MAITLTQEQFKQRYGQEGLDAFKSPAEINTPQEKPGFFSRAGTALKERFGEVKKTFGETARGEISPVETGVRLVGDVAGGVGDVVGAALSPQVEKLAQKEWAKPAFEALAGGMEKYEEWKNSSELNRRTAEVLEGVVNIADLAGISAGAKATVKTTAKVAGKVAKEVADTVGDVARGVKSTGIAQKTTELVERVPRVIGRAKESLGESKLKAGKIRESSPSVQKAYKANLDERIINTVVQADEPTKQAYKQMVDIAEESSDVLKIKKKPSSIAGDVASRQYKLIEKQRKNIGEQMNEATKKLSKDRSISMEDGFRQADDILGSQGIKINYTKKGAKLDFTGTKFTPSERTRIQELYSLAVEGGNKLSPNQVHLKDQLFSKLQRESRMEGVGDIMVETAEGNKSLFNVFRDIYSNKLDEVFPEIKDLNKQYREIKTLLDDIEGSITKGGNFEVVKSTDPSVFAQTNLRRILSDAQSAGSYSEIVKKMDEFARTLGYEGAKADELILFAEELKKLYPDTISKTGFSGGISTGIKSATLDLIGGILKTGTPNLKDQQKALRELLKDLAN